MDNTQTPVVTAAAASVEVEKFKKWKASNTWSTVESQYRNTFIVFGKMGIMLINLGIVIMEAVPAAREEVQWCLRIRGQALSPIFNKEIGKQLQYAVTIGFFFSAACWPVMIFPGYGSEMLADFLWSYEMSNHTIPAELKECMPPLKLASHRTRIFTSVPSDLRQLKMTLNTWPSFQESNKSERWLNRLYDEVRASGFPQPKDGSFKVTRITIPFASYRHHGFFRDAWSEDPYYVVRDERDPGKLLYAYTEGGALNLRAGELILPIDRTDYILLSWLEGLDGMTFRLMKDEVFDNKHPQFKSTKRWVLDPTRPSINVVAVRDEIYVNEKKEAKKRLELGQAYQSRPVVCACCADY